MQPIPADILMQGIIWGHPFKGHRQAKKAILWRETERFSSSLFVILSLTIAAVSFCFGVSLHCTSHPSGLRSLVMRFIY
jgi:hypothetical protein